MNAEIVHRLQESFEGPDYAEAIASDVASEISSELYGVFERLEEIQSQNRAILSHLGLPDPVAEAKAREAEKRKARMDQAGRTEALRRGVEERAVEELEKRGFKVARIPKQTDKDDNGEKQ
jgi:hypothetical protein